MVVQSVGGPSRYLVGVGILAYGRPSLLREALISLAGQEDADPFPLVVLDNGSKQPLEPQTVEILREFPGPVTMLREEQNALSPSRFAKVINAVEADFVLLPGDDDIAASNYISVAQALVTSDPQITLFSSAMGQINSRGQKLATTNAPPHFGDRPAALGALINRASYCMPVTGVRKSILDLESSPRTRTAFDWWLWLQAWLAGSASVSATQTLWYRQHAGQEQRRYGTHAFRNDAARMLLELIWSDRFATLLDSWSSDEVDRFAREVLLSDGPNSGDSRWGPLIQMTLVDRLVERTDSDMVYRLYAQANGQAGTPVSVGALRTLAPDVEITGLPTETWSRVPIRITWQGVCSLVQAWSSYLNIPSATRPQFEIAVMCTCFDEQSSSHVLKIQGVRCDDHELVAIQIAGPPDEANTVRVLDLIGQMTGRLHGFEAHLNDEALVLSLYRRLRLTRFGNLLERAYRSISKSSVP